VCIATLAVTRCRRADENAEANGEHPRHVRAREPRV